MSCTLVHRVQSVHRARSRVLTAAALVCTLASACGEEEKAAGTPMDEEEMEETGSCPEPEFSADGSELTVTLEHGGMERSYIVYVPTSVDPSKATPLLMNYHGLTSNPTQQIMFSGMNALADEKGFIVVYPTGISNSFNAGSCCGTLASPPNEADDADFTRAIVADVSSKICVDKRRVYSTGMSNGGYMTEYNACTNASLFAAVAPVSAMGMPQPSCDPSRPISMIAFNGTADGLVPYDGSVSSVADWVERNGCTGEPTRVEHGAMSSCETWSSCESGTEVVHCTLEGMGHCWPGTDYCPYGAVNTEISANEMMWEFLTRFTLPEAE